MRRGPIFPFFGGKWRGARLYRQPERDHVIEPFAGSAGYSSFWEPKKVTLIEIDPVIAGVWKYLLRASSSEIMSLPVDIDHVDEVHACQEARWLIGFHLDVGRTKPAICRSGWGQAQKNWKGGTPVWSASTRLRIARQVEKIRDWRIIEGSYENAPDVDAHWFIDPPYQATGHAYSYADIDYAALGEWCLQRRGFVQVCEGDGADWLPFGPGPILTTTIRKKEFSTESLFEFESEHMDAQTIIKARRLYRDHQSEN